MFRTSQIIRVSCVIIALLAIAAVAVAQERQGNPGASPLATTMVKTGLYLISGGGGNSLVRMSMSGPILVDSKLPGTYEALRKQVRRISEQPVAILINTDQHEKDTGNNAEFRSAGARIFAHENPQHSLAPTTETFDHDYVLRWGGIKAELMHFGNAHTGGDTVVYFPNLKVVAVGDLFSAMPDPDFTAGGSLVGWGPVLADILKLDFDTVIAGSGPPIGRAELEAFKRRIDAVVSRAIGLVGSGVPKNQLMARLEAADPGWKFDFTGDRLDRFYAELSLAAKHGNGAGNAIGD